ncbi:MAG: hypothetical protein AB7S26_21620 [Sandaracinaceae bacterium]
MAAALEELVAAVDAIADPEARGRARALVAGVLELHREGLEAALSTLRARPDGAALIDALAAAPAVNAMLLLHGLHPVPAVERVRAALAHVEPELRGLGARVADVRATDGAFVVRVTRDDPSRHGAAIHRFIEDALVAAAPDLEPMIEGTEDVPLVRASRLVEGR